MLVRLLVVGLLVVATLAGVGTSAWALFNGANDTTFRPVVLGPEDVPSPIEGLAVDPEQAAPTPEPMPESAAPPEPWPPAHLRERAIELALNDPEMAELLRGHRYGAFTVNLYTDKAGPCSDLDSLSCVEVGFYDYTVPTGLKVIVNLATDEVLDRRAVPEFQPGPSEEELAEMAAIIAADPAFGPGAVIDRAAGIAQIDNTDLGGQCGQVSPLHRCLQVKVTKPDGTANWVVIDLIEGRVVEVYPSSY